MSHVTRVLPLLALAGACKQPINVFGLQDDIDLGQQVRDQIAEDPESFPILPEEDYRSAYDHLYRVRDAVLASGELEYRDEFAWEVYLVHDDETLNAFAAPGGYLYFYTGLLRFLDREDDFAGVMGHEIAHADRRHTTQQLTRNYGIATLLGVVLGENPGLLAEIAAGLVSLRFSRGHEAEADEYSVRYLCRTDYAADGAAGFFAKLREAGGIEVPEFLSTHPSPGNRVEDIRGLAGDLGCSTAPDPAAPWDDFLASLPPVDAE